MIFYLKRSTQFAFVLFLFFKLVMPDSAIAADYDLVRINGGEPIITQAMFNDAGVPDEGENINGPSVIRIPDWIDTDSRAHPDAQYYLYFAHHSGDFIRMAWASDIEGPWQLFQIGANVPVGNRGVLDLGDHEIYLDNGITIPNNHLASPDAHVDNVNQRIILYFHSGSSTYVNGEEIHKQLTYVSTSPDGLDFYNNIEPVILGPSYFRVFKYKQNLYALTNDGTPYQALDAESPWSPPAGFDFTDRLWKKHPDNPFQRDITDDGISKSVLRVRHTAVRVVGDELHVFYSRRGDAPERIQMSTIDLSVGDWELWDSTYPPTELLRAEPGWEGGEFPAEPSKTSSAPENVNQLRDPYVFEDADGSLYLFYTGRGEDAIGIAALTYNTTDIAAEQKVHLPETASIQQNFPNPFNSSTKIKYHVSHAAFIEMKIINSQGALVASLLHDYQAAGDYAVVWRPGDVASGIYFCQLRVNNKTLLQKVTYLK